MAIVKVKVNREGFSNLTYSYIEKDVSSGYSCPVNKHVIPNAWAVDVVEISTLRDRQWYAFDWDLDRGFTWASEEHIRSDSGTAVIRKKVNGKWVDTNNSTNDFNHHAWPPSLQEVKPDNDEGWED